MELRAFSKKELDGLLRLRSGGLQKMFGPWET